MYTYPARATGTAQDLMSIVTRAGERAIAREGLVLPRKTAWARRLCEPPCNLAGRLAQALSELMPADWALAWQDRAFRTLAAGRSFAFDARSPALARAAAEARALRAETGQEPALVALLSHPPVLGELGSLNFELVRQASLALRAVRGRPCRPRLLVAMDPYALDTAGLPAEGFYAGFMGLYHLGVDRLSFARGPLSRLIVGETAWPLLALRLLRRLGRGGEVAVVLSGGVPSTARVLYTAREWMAAQRRLSPLRAAPARVLRALRRWEDYRRFETRGPCGPGLRRSAWRMLEAWALSAAAGRPWDDSAQEPAAAETGRLEPAARDVLGRCLEALGLSGARRAAALARLAEEWPRQTPWRRRLFSVLAGRILARGRAIVFVPVVHRRGPRSGVEVREAWSWRQGSAQGLRGRILGPAPRDWQGTADDFAVAFGRENYV